MEKENSSQNEQQTKHILLNIKSNILILSNGVLAFKNKMFDEFINEIVRQMIAMGKLVAEQIIGDLSQVFLNERLFKLPKNGGTSVDPSFILREDNLTMLEINERLENLETSHLVEIKTGKGKKRTFVISKQKIIFEK